MSESAIDFEALLDASPHPYVLLDPAFTIVWANRAYQQVTGRALSAIRGCGIFEAFPTGPHDPGGESERRLRASLERVRAERQPDVLALIRYAIPRAGEAGAAFEERYWSATHTPVFDAQGRLRYILQQADDVTELHRLRSAIEADSVRGFEAELERIGSDVYRRAEAVQSENRSLQSERRRLRQLFLQAPGFVAFMRGPQHVFELVNDAYSQLIGHRDVIGRPLREALPEVQGQGYVELLDEVFSTGEAFVGRDMRALLQRQPGAPLDEVYLDLVYQPIVGPDGAMMGVFAQGIDVTERYLGQQRQKLLMAELDHRVKNVMAVVQSIAMSSLGGRADADVFIGRVTALARTHTLLAESRWTGAQLAQVVEEALAPYAAATEGRFQVSGPPALLNPREAQSLGLAFHELATNAAKHGAFSRPEGRVEVTWSVERPEAQPPRLAILWCERGGPAPAPQRRAGFGSLLIQRALAHELSAEVALDYDPAGLSARIALPFRAAVL